MVGQQFARLAQLGARLEATVRADTKVTALDLAAAEQAHAHDQSARR
jgi:hypothetical protein